MSGSTPKVIFIGSVDRSGSTLLDCMLGQIRGFTSTGELRRLWDRGLENNELCGCGRPLRECEFWMEVIQEAYGGFDRLDPRVVNNLGRSLERIRYIPRLSFSLLLTGACGDRLEQCARVLGRLYRAISRVSASRVIVDSSKAPLYGFVLNAIDELDVRVVHVVRDSRAVAHSLQRQRLRPEVYFQRAWMETKEPAKSALDWDVRNALLELLRFTGSRYLQVRYEDLARRPKATLTAIIRHVGEPIEALDFIKDGLAELAPTHTVSGNPMRFQRGAVPIRLDEEWRRAMDDRARRVVTALTWPLLRAYGYPLTDVGHRAGESDALEAA